MTADLAIGPRRCRGTRGSRSVGLPLGNLPLGHYRGGLSSLSGRDFLANERRDESSICSDERMRRHGRARREDFCPQRRMA